ncbi:MAG TPA: thiolase domain-containing protein [Kiloniellales bacterium]|nr:thiolase domain-containing protein [Kiloniellales bacterium]
MSLKRKAYIAGAFEHPTRFAPDKSVPQLHAECAAGALADAGLSFADVDGYLCGGDAPGHCPLFLAEYMNLRLSYLNGTELGGCSYLLHVAHAAAAIDAGLCSVCLITLAGKPRSSGQVIGPQVWTLGPEQPEVAWQLPYRWTLISLYALCAQRHMHDYGTTPEQLAWVKVAASQHAQHNPNALLRKVFTVEDVLASPMLADPIRRLDCCIVTDGGGAMVVVRPEIARSLKRPLVPLLGSGQSALTSEGGDVDVTVTGAVHSGPPAFAEAGVAPADIKYVSIYDNFTVMVMMQLEDLGFCRKGEGGRFVADGNLISGQGRLPFNTDGGGLCNNHPANRGGMTKAIEAVRQLRGEAHPAVQVPNCDLALASGPGQVLGNGHGHATIILGRE